MNVKHRKFAALIFLALKVTTTCPKTSNDHQQTINSPNFPSNYGNFMHCTWKIEAPVSRLIRVHSFAYSIQTCTYCVNDACDTDVLKILDGPSYTSNMIVELCGSNTISGLASTWNTLFLEFETNIDFVYTGFNIQYSLIGIFVTYQ